MPSSPSVERTQRFQRAASSFCPNRYAPLKRKSSSTNALESVAALLSSVRQRRYVFQSSSDVDAICSFNALKKSGLPTFRLLNFGALRSTKYWVSSMLGASAAAWDDGIM